MTKEAAKEHILKNLTPGDSLVGFFIAQQPFKLWLFFIIGPLAVLSMKQYFIAVTQKGIHFHRLNLWGKFASDDFFAFNEIATVKIGKGMLQRPMKFTFKNGRNIYIKAQLKGVEKVAKLDEATQKHIEQHIAVVK
ncbi:hypothetical protein [Methylomonas rosea]|uniref:YokE-like PH domain-containing protein n=1 Tax=Methylomonas rosea TaxID=2952227 RepID=A0ABT1TWW5_9GAMM|nr:hypothetical protein [Methylomonas sp. WSC-7]MCQ8119260.1 hypothetical protein [Methylomonas sp. WSC-7]